MPCKRKNRKTGINPQKDDKKRTKYQRKYWYLRDKKTGKRL